MPEQRDLLLIPVPFTDLSSIKRRPVVVLSSTLHNQRGEDVVVAAVTSNLSSRGEGVTISSQDFETGSLPVQSYVRADKIYTLSQTIIVKWLGRLGEPSFQSILSRLDSVLGR